MEWEGFGGKGAADADWPAASVTISKGESLVNGEPAPGDNTGLFPPATQQR